MKLDQRYEQLDPMRRLALAAAAAERVLPICLLETEGGSVLFDDSLRFVWFQLGGGRVSKQELARVLNEVLGQVPFGDEVPAAQAAGQALVDTLEAALHNPEASRAAVESALTAVREHAGEEASRDERKWQNEAVRLIVERDGLLRRDMFASVPVGTEWRTALTSSDLPLFGERSP